MLVSQAGDFGGTKGCAAQAIRIRLSAGTVCTEQDDDLLPALVSRDRRTYGEVE